MTTTQAKFERVEAALRSDEPAALSSVLADIRAADLAEIYETLGDDERSKLIFALPPEVVAEVVVLLDEVERGEVVEEMAPEELSEIVAQMEPDDAADVLGELSEEKREDVLDTIADEHADKIEELLGYPEDTAGGIMTKDLVALHSGATVREAVREIRTNFPNEDLHYVYVVDESERLIGIIPLRRLVLSDGLVRLGDICERDPVTVPVTADQEEVVHVFSKYDLAAIPVVDAEGRLLGRITHDDVMDVAEEEADEDIFRMAGLATAEFERASIVRAAGLRLSWLVPCMASMSISAAVMSMAQKWFATPIYNALIVFVPMIGAIGGNCGIQISTVIVRGLATGELASSRFRNAFVREGRIALLMAPACGLAALIIARFGVPLLESLLQYHAGGSLNRTALAVGLGMTSAILVAASLGMALPFVFRAIRVDPAIASGPIVTTVNDLISVTVFLSLALIIMHP